MMADDYYLSIPQSESEGSPPVWGHFRQSSDFHAGFGYKDSLGYRIKLCFTPQYPKSEMLN